MVIVKKTAKYIRNNRNYLLFVVLLLDLIGINIAISLSSDLYKYLILVILLALLLILFKLSKFSLRDTGLIGGNIKQILLWALLPVIVIALVAFVAFLIKQDLFLDKRYDFALSRMLFYVLVVIPFTTVFLEEFIFRGFMWSYIKKYKTVLWATIGSSVLFSLWHILPAKAMDRTTLASYNISSGITLLLIIGGTLVATLLAGVVLCELRKRSNSLYPPIAAHWAINSIAVIFAYIAWH